ncbi:unnamed protein product, partial [Amoebophrya sp. A120]
PWEPDYWSQRWVLNAIDQATSWPRSFICKSKAEAGAKLQVWINEEGPPKRVRSDNAKEFKEPGSTWKKTAQKQ